MSILRSSDFETNIPRELILASDGVIKEGRFGNQVFYQLAEPANGAAYFPIIVGEKINMAEIQRGERFRLCKREVKPANGKAKPSIEWVVERLEQQRRAPTPAEATGIPETDLERQLRETQELLERLKREKAAKAAVSPAAQAAQTGTFTQATSNTANGTPKQNGNGNGHMNGSTPGPTPVPLKIPLNIAFREILTFCTAELKAAGEQWSDGARQDLVSTLLIQAAREGWCTIWERGGAR